MSQRKEVEKGCDGSVFCGVPGHVTKRTSGRDGFLFSHIPLTVGQRKTIRERKAAARAFYEETLATP